MSDDPRVAVSRGLRRLREGGAWPAANLVTFQNLLLDQAGGDTRPLVGLLLRAVEHGVVEEVATASVAEWELRRAQCIARLIANAFVQPEMARWAVHAWGHAFGLETEAALPAPATDAVADSREGERWRARVAPVTFTSTRPGARRAPAAMSGASSWTPTPAPLSPQDLRRDRITQAVVFGLLLLTLLPVGWTVLTRPPDWIPPAASAVAPAASNGPVAANGVYSGRYRVERTLESITGDPSCNDGAAAVHWPVPSTEIIRYDSATGDFQFRDRPEVRGHVSAEGDFEVGPVAGEKEGIRYIFRMVGHFTPTGFEARAATATRTVIAWLKLEECQLSGRLSARRLE